MRALIDPSEQILGVISPSPGYHQVKVRAPCRKAVEGVDENGNVLNAIMSGDAEHDFGAAWNRQGASNRFPSTAGKHSQKGCISAPRNHLDSFLWDIEKTAHVACCLLGHSMKPADIPRRASIYPDRSSPGAATFDGTRELGMT
jgi:hypothetical protein